MELDVRQREGQLLDRDEIRRALFAISRQVRDRILGIPDRIADLLAAESDSVVVYQTINFHHYVVDGLIWKVRKPKLQKTLALAT